MEQIEHRLFSYISMNWAGQPLISHEVAVNLIAGTTTRIGLTVHAELDTGTYPPRIKISDREMKQLMARHVTPHQFPRSVELRHHHTRNTRSARMSVVFISKP